MPSYHAPIKDIKFILQNVLEINDSEIPGYSELDNEYLNAILEEASKISTEGTRTIERLLETNTVVALRMDLFTLHRGLKRPLINSKTVGGPGIDCDTKFGGQGLPYLISIAVGEMFASANMALGMYHGLTHGVYSAIYSHGSDEQKAKYLPNLINCNWTGTMNLTEPHCGTDLGLMRTKATREDDGTFKISGQKIFISAGDHDLAENIIHLVLAKIPDGPEGVKGISLFIVPKFLTNEDGSLGERNQVSVGKIERKMGIHGNATCVMNYDESGRILSR
jgi:alkylation response protein AidB-like acyl-CoA dehydrogenase